MKMHERLRAYMDGRALKLRIVAKKSGIEEKRFYRLLDGSSPLRVDEYERIVCDGLELDPGFFFNQNFLDSKIDEDDTA
ncbi:MAG: hypothetical protein ACYCYO_02205 [Bacilli bacterium]